MSSKPTDEELQQESSSHPPGWPGIPGRSREHDGHPEGEDGHRHAESEEGDAEVTEAQRKLERGRTGEPVRE